VLEHGSERAIDSVLSGPLPEAVARSLLEHQVIERIVAEVLQSDAADEKQLAARIDEILRRPDVAQLVEGMTGMVVRSPAFREAVMGIVADPAFRHALTQQAAGFSGELGTALRARAASADETLETAAHRLVRRPPGEQTAAYGGFATRALALIVDAALAQLAFIVLVASVALVASLVGAGRDGPVVGALLAGGWLVVETVYFVVFWSATGQTPGMRLTHVRVVDKYLLPPSVARSVLRVIGLYLAIIPLFAGFLPALLDKRRRALPDYLAGTVVIANAVTPTEETVADIQPIVVETATT